MSIQAPEPASPPAAVAVSGKRAPTGTPSGNPPPPEWAIERLIKTIGKAPATVGKGLDHLAKLPIIGPIIRLFSSVIFGLVILGLIGTYIAVGSGFAGLRAKMEMTDLEFFDAWPMQLLLLLLVLDLSIVTLRRIPMTLFKMGSWTVHIGILTMITGCVWYFSCKEEGSVRIYLNQTVDHCYDVTERALYAFPMKADGTFDTANPRISRMPGMPIYFEHIAEQGNPLDYAMPNILGDNAKNISAKVVGYYPSAVMPRGVSIVLMNGQSISPEQRLLNSPAERILDADEAPFGIEYLRNPTPEQKKDLLASFEGKLGLVVRVPGQNIERIYPAEINKPITVEGTPYTLVPKEVGAIPMISKGYEGAFSSMLTVAVTRKDAQGTFEFERQSIFRFPERSPDWVMENGQKKRKQGGVDANIDIRFIDGTRPQIWVVEESAGAASKPIISIYYRENGKAVQAQTKDDLATIPLTQLPTLKLHAEAGGKPQIIPPTQRPRGQTAMDAMQLSIIELELTGPNGWKQGEVYIPFSPFATVGTEQDQDNPDEQPVGKPPAVVDVPGVGKVGLLMATTKRPLPADVTLTKFEPVHYPGAQKFYADYLSTIDVKNKSTGQQHTLVAQLNGPAADQGLYYFQSGWDGDDHAPPEKRYTVLGVGNRPGIWVMTTGALLIIAGIGFAFYVKPILLKKKKAQLAAWAASNKRTTN